MNSSEIAHLLLTPDALVTLSLQDAQTVAGYMTVSKRPEGAVIFEANRVDIPNDYMLLVLSGDVLIEADSLGDNAVVVTILSVGHLIGEMSVLDGAPRSATCTAQTDVEVAMLTGAALERLLAAHPSIGARFVLAIAKRLADRVRLNNHKLLILSKVNQAMQQEIDVKSRKRSKHRFIASSDV
ncbi:MAG: cyclic nucleotide-binding domain-containing protein [Cytophagales bacterium]|nr:cyclic nucleotide-binding domain-containing protein [Cytophagales bacterium]